jgi:uncharacterized protein GlcG (DUF336 family)
LEDFKMDLLKLAKDMAVRVEAEAVRTKLPVTVSVVDAHGNIVLIQRMNGALAFSMGISERKAYTSALIGVRTADLFAMVQSGQPLFALMSQSQYCAMGGGAPLLCDGKVVAGLGVSGGTVDQDVAILEGALRDR